MFGADPVRIKYSQNSELEVEDDENSIWSLNFGKLQFSPQTLENLQNGPWSQFRDSEQNKI